MRVALTGAAGFVGSSILRELVVQGHHAIAIDNLATGRLANVEDVRCDWRCEDAGTSDYGTCEAVIHAAAYPDVSANWKNKDERDRQWRDNAELTRRVLDRVVEGSILGEALPFVLLSTCSVYGDGGLVDASSPTRATSPYAASKLAAEKLVEAYTEAGKIRGTVLRLVNVVGTRYAHGHLSDFVAMARAGRIHARDDGKKRKSFVHVADVAAEAVRSLEALWGTPRNVASEVLWSWRDSVAMMRAMRPDLGFELSWDDRAGGWIGDPAQLQVNPGANVCKRSIVEGVRESLESLGWTR